MGCVPVPDRPEPDRPEPDRPEPDQTGPTGTGLYSTVQYCRVLYSTAQYCTVQYLVLDPWSKVHDPWSKVLGIRFSTSGDFETKVFERNSVIAVIRFLIHATKRRFCKPHDGFSGLYTPPRPLVNPSPPLS